MYRSVLIGIDQRDGSADAVALARLLAPHSQRMSLVNVRNRYYPGMRGIAPDEEAADRSRSLERLGAVRDAFALDAELLSVAATSVGSGIRDAARKLEADLIVVGSCHRSALGRVLGGDDATSTLHHAPCAVAIAPHGYARGDATIHVIGVAYDGSPQSAAALTEARGLAPQLAATISALDVEAITITGYGWIAPYVENQEILIANARRRLGDIAGVALDVVVGMTGDELVRFSDDVDVLVCGSRDRGPVKRVMLGSVGAHLARHARSPLIIVPAVAQTGDAPAHDRLVAATA